MSDKKAEDVMGDAWDRCAEDLILKFGIGVLGGGVGAFSFQKQRYTSRHGRFGCWLWGWFGVYRMSVHFGKFEKIVDAKIYQCQKGPIVNLVPNSGSRNRRLRTLYIAKIKYMLVTPKEDGYLRASVFAPPRGI